MQTGPALARRFPLPPAGEGESSAGSDGFQEYAAFGDEPEVYSLEASASRNADARACT